MRYKLTIPKSVTAVVDEAAMHRIMRRIAARNPTLMELVDAEPDKMRGSQIVADVNGIVIEPLPESES